MKGFFRKIVELKYILKEARAFREYMEEIAPALGLDTGAPSDEINEARLKKFSKILEKLDKMYGTELHIYNRRMESQGNVLSEHERDSPENHVAATAASSYRIALIKFGEECEKVPNSAGFFDKLKHVYADDILSYYQAQNELNNSGYPTTIEECLDI